MKILFILPEYYPHSGGGISTYYINYIKALRPFCSKIKVIVGSGYFNGNDSFTVDDIEIEHLKPEIYNASLTKFSRFNIAPEFKRNLAAAWAMYEQANEGKEFDIIESMDFGFGFIPWVIKHNKPVITRLHGSSGQIALHETNKNDNFISASIKQTELLLLPLCDGLITHSKVNRDFWNKLLHTKKVINIHPVYDVSVKQPLSKADREDYGLVTGRIQQWKGPVQLCQALRIIKGAERPQIKWVGRDMLFTQNKSTVKHLEETFPDVWNKNIIPQRPLHNDKIQLLQRKAKFGLVPSTWDMFNFACLEFLAAGTPVICSDGAGSSEIIEQGKSGLKYSANNTNELANCIGLINNMDDIIYRNMALAGIKTIQSQLSADKLIPQNLNQYKTILESFKVSSSNPYLEAIYMPEDKNYDIADILDTQPLKMLTKYYIKRLRLKLTRRK